jgi:regulator of protease activity HflC (stomatin/prohibitin superfamily)
MSTVIENQAQTVSERRGRATAGLLPAVVIIVVGVVGALLFFGGVAMQDGLLIVVAVVLLLGSAFAGVGLYMLQPNQAAVLTFFGDYRGTDRSPGLRWTNPLCRRRKISLRVRNFNTTTSKVNDANGNPIQVAAVVVWQVVDTGRATFEVDDLVDYVIIQAEARCAT